MKENRSAVYSNVIYLLLEEVEEECGDWIMWVVSSVQKDLEKVAVRSSNSELPEAGKKDEER